MAEEENNVVVLEVSPSGGETTHWMVSWAADESTADEDTERMQTAEMSAFCPFTP